MCLWYGVCVCVCGVVCLSVGWMCVCGICMSVVCVWCGVFCLWGGYMCVCVHLWCVVCVYVGVYMCVCVCARATRSTFSRTVEARFYLGSEKYNKGHLLKHQ